MCKKNLLPAVGPGFLSSSLAIRSRAHFARHNTSDLLQFLTEGPPNQETKKIEQDFNDTTHKL